jgi:Jag N-terminus
LVCSVDRRGASPLRPSRPRAAPGLATTAATLAPAVGVTALGPALAPAARARHRVARRVAAARGARRDPHRLGVPVPETGENPVPVGALPERARRVASSAEASARTVAVAVEAAAAKLGLRPDQVEVEVLKQPVPSTFGKIGEAAVVRVTERTGAAEPVESVVAVGAQPAAAVLGSQAEQHPSTVMARREDLLADAIRR